MSRITISNEAIISVMFGILASVVTFTAYDVSTGGGGADCTFYDYGALAFGSAAIVAGLVALVNGTRSNDLPSSALGALAIAVGVLRVAYGSGTAFSPCG